MIAKPGYISVMKTYADQQTNDDWLLLEFSALGFIGTSFNSFTLKAPITTAADDSHKYFFIVFQRK